MTIALTDYSLRKLLETPIKDFKTQLTTLNSEQVDEVVKEWLKECHNLKRGNDNASELFKRAICVLPVSSQPHIPALVNAFGLDGKHMESFTLQKSILLDSDFRRKQLSNYCSLDLEKVNKHQFELISLEFLLNERFVPTVKEFRGMLSQKLLDCRTPEGKDIVEILSRSPADGLEKLAQPLIDFYIENCGTEVFQRRLQYIVCRDYYFDKPKNQCFSLFKKTVENNEAPRPLDLLEAWKLIHQNFDYEAHYWHYRYNSLITDSIPKAESKLQEELNILAILLHDSRSPEGRKICGWPKILEDQKGELRPLLKEELLDVKSSRNNDIYDEVLHYGSLKDIEQLLTFVREKRGDDALNKFVQGRGWSAIWFINRGVLSTGDERLQRAKQLVALYKKFGLDPKTFIFNPENSYEDLLSRTIYPKLLEYLLMQLSEKERRDACKLRGNGILYYGRDYSTSEKLCKTIYTMTGLTREDFTTPN